jgi:hypothetical protein
MNTDCAGSLSAVARAQLVASYGPAVSMAVGLRKSAFTR